MDGNRATSVREQHRFNAKNLQRYLAGKVKGVSDRSVLTVRQYSSGQSNPTFLLQSDGHSYVLRKKPPGRLLPGAHKVDREYTVQKALFSAGFPVPQPLLYCSDAEIIGTEFYVMEHAEGRIFRDMRLPGVSAAERTALYVCAAETLAKLHSIDLATLGLVGYGKGAGYCKRQVLTWTKQYKASAHKEIPAMDQLSDWLMKNLPLNDSDISLVHGDFRIDNLIFHPTETRVVAVLDWELSTTGHPLADLGYFLMPSYWPSEISVISTMGGVTGIDGFPSVKDLISVYCHCRGIPPSIPELNFFVALSFFKLAAIAQGVYARSLLGNASAPNAAEFGESVEPLAKVGLDVACSPSRAVAVPDRLFLQSPKGRAVLLKVRRFIQEHILPSQQEVFDYYTKHEHSPQRWVTPPIIEDLKVKARAAGLWNLFLPAVSGLSQLDYAHIAEETGCCVFAPDVFNCQAPDTGNMEVLHMFGSEEQKRVWLEPLLRGDIKSCFCMTEPDVASSDATNMECSLEKDGDHYIITGRKWWSSGAGNLNCKIAIVMCRNKISDPNNRHGQHSMILVPMDMPGVKRIRPLTVFGQDDAVHGGHLEIAFENVRVPASNIILGEGRGFEIAQGRLGPGRLHHCMRAVGLAETALQLLCQRAAKRQAFGKKLYQHEVVAHWIAECRISIEQTRLLTLSAAHALDTQGNKVARKQIAMIKVAAGRMACKVVDCSIQVHGGAGLSSDFPLAHMYSYARSLRLADGPDEVHLSSIAGMELRDQLKRARARL
ncbi:acyl-CoA dehydrogenase family member 11 [Denticeps clupeoides]|uniref:acyl-CoA dehydrogenase family member 11 n=1 Tax=Denticeps clupeoides TaxID=299321 RepID=UPI0010A36444|nr:acyl-CoA dehydrogenase family member 11 [Denticeps clupeoides]